MTVKGWAAFDGDKPRVRHPIDTAPRDGTLIVVGDPDVGEFCMQWGHIAKNEVFAPDSVGMWIMPDHSMTWSEADDCGPATWRPLRTAREARIDALLLAVLARVSRQGDMAIRIAARTYEAILQRVGFDWRVGDEAFREVDAPALEALVRLAGAPRS